MPSPQIHRIPLNQGSPWAYQQIFKPRRKCDPNWLIPSESKSGEDRPSHWLLPKTNNSEHGRREGKIRSRVHFQTIEIFTDVHSEKTCEHGNPGNSFKPAIIPGILNRFLEAYLYYGTLIINYKCWYLNHKYGSHQPAINFMLFYFYPIRSTFRDPIYFLESAFFRLSFLLLISLLEQFIFFSDALRGARIYFIIFVTFLFENLSA